MKKDYYTYEFEQEMRDEDDILHYQEDLKS